MATKPDAHKPHESMSFPQFGKDQTETMKNLQQELQGAYEQTSRAWLARMKSEMDLWSELGAKLGATRSIPEALQAYQETMTKRMEMAADDGQRLVTDGQEMAQKITRSLGKGWPTTWALNAQEH
jgi:hypothetical protein